MQTNRDDSLNFRRSLQVEGQRHATAKSGVPCHGWSSPSLAAAVLVALMLAIGSAAAGAQSDARTIADRYMDAYQAGNFDALAELWAVDGVFIDPTSLAQPGGGYHFVGRDAILTGLKAAFDNPQTKIEAADYSETTVFEEAGYVVYSGSVVVTVRVKADDRRVRYTMPITTILQVRNDKVVEHRDYADYSGTQFEQVP